MSGLSPECQRTRQNFQEAYNAYVKERELLAHLEKSGQNVRAIRETQAQALEQAQLAENSAIANWDKLALGLAENPGFNLEGMQAGLLPVHAPTPPNALAIGPIHVRQAGPHLLWGLAPSRESLNEWSAQAWLASQESEHYKHEWEDQVKKVAPLKNEFDTLKAEEEKSHRRCRVARERKAQAMIVLEKTLSELRLSCQGQLAMEAIDEEKQLVITPGMLPEQEQKIRALLKNDISQKANDPLPAFALHQAEAAPSQEGAYLYTLNAESQASYQKIKLPDEPPDPDLEDLYLDLPALHKKARIPRWVWFLLAALASVIVIMQLL